MARPSRGPHIYTRLQGGQVRYYADFRSFGGRREALIARGETVATTDPVIAQKLFSARLEQLQEGKRNRQLLGVERTATLKEYAASHLVKKAKTGAVTKHWLEACEFHLQTAVEFFGADRDLGSIDVADVQRFAEHLAALPNGKGGTLQPGTQRKYLNSLSNLFRRAQGERVVTGVNPVSALMDKPKPGAEEAEWLEVWEAALYLESARTYPGYQERHGTLAGRLHSAVEGWGGAGDFAVRRFIAHLRELGRTADEEQVRRYLSGDGMPDKHFLKDAATILGVEPAWIHNADGNFLRPLSAYVYPLVATDILTGGRETEVLGLEVKDVSFRRKTVTFRPNAWRALKTRTSHRTVPLWPQLELILEEYIDGGARARVIEQAREANPARTIDISLVFPSEKTGGLIHDYRKALDAIGERVGWEAGEIRSKMFRHTYCAARLQTLDRGHPVAEFTVAKEMGHGGFTLVRKVYGHLGTIRHRSEVVEYLLEQHAQAIPAERIRLLEVI
jgi:integrase